VQTIVQILYIGSRNQNFLCMKTMAFILIFLYTSILITAQNDPWYFTHETGETDQVSFMPLERLEFRVVNPLDVDRKNSLVTIVREGFPLPDLHEMWVTVVDPTLPPYEGPDEETLEMYGGHQLRAEVNGHAIFHQLDDLDKDGIWDELVFQTDLGPGEEKTIYIYIGENIQGWNPHRTHAGIGSYCRHQMPFWESENMGWKIWFANSIDVYAKRKPVLISHHLYMENLDGYAVAMVDPDWGSDIQSVAGSMGGGAICLFEHPDRPDSISLPRFTPNQGEAAPEGSLWNAGQISDTRYAYEVVVNGPVRSMIRIKTMNWNTGDGTYAVDQYFSVYAHQSYSTCRSRYTTFQPLKAGVEPGVGIRKKPGEEHLVQDGGILISAGPEQIRDPEDIDDRAAWFMPFIGKALVVMEKYEPQYRFIQRAGGQHTFRLTAGEDKSFEYMLFAGWSEGAVHNNAKDFEAYVRQSAREFNHPLETRYIGIEEKPGRKGH
jgi:hypothetical protein